MISTLLAVLALGASDEQVLKVQACAPVEVNQFQSSTCLIDVQNLTDERVSVAKVVALASGDVVKLPPSLEIAPHGAWQFSAEVRWENALGLRFHRFDIVLNNGQHKLVDAHGYVNSVLDEAKPSVDLGVVEAGGHSRASTISVASRELPSLRLIRVVEAPSFVETKIEPNGTGVTLKTTPDAPWGAQVGFAKFETNEARQPQVWVEVKADIHGAVIPTASPFDLGLMRTGQRHEFLIRLDHRDQKSFRVGKLGIDGLKATAELDTCAAGTTGCRVVKLTVSDDQPLGAVKGKLLVELPEFKRTLPISLWGILLSPETKIQSLDTSEAAQASGPMVGARSEIQAKADIKSALREAVREPPIAADPAGRGPLLKWQVANENAVYGYAIYRADEEGGALKRLNQNALQPISTDGHGASYSWRDTSAEPGRPYWYRISVLFQDGRKQDLTGVQKVVAK